MIENISINNYALIDHTHIELEKGFSVITGETGAGKSILLGAIGLTLGQRADSSAIMDKTKKCIVEIEYNIAGYALKEWFDENDLDYSEQVMVRRELTAEGKSRCFINDTPVNNKLLKDFGAYMVDIHSQHQSLLLGHPEYQTDILDEQIGSDQFRGSMQVRVSRPVYNSSYSTVLLNFRDNDIDYIYREFEPLEYSETGQNSNLVNLLAFYANIILGIDYDSFSLMGGNDFFNRAETIVARCQNAKESGWKSFENRRNRYWLINNLQDRSYASVRECIYKYHRLGLDVMSDNLTDGRLAILEALGLLQKAHRIKPNSYLMQVFFDAKADEIVHIFKPAFTDERKRIFNIVSEVNPANSSKYNALIQEKTN